MILKKTLLIIVLYAFSGGCTPITVKSDYDTNYDFTKLKTFGWGSGSIQLGHTERGLDSILHDVEAMVRRDVQPLISAVLVEKGFEPDESGYPDFIVQYYGSGSPGYGLPRPSYTGKGTPNPSWEVKGGSFVMGALSITITESASSKVIWNGYGETVITGKGTNNAKLKRGIKKILKSFPPK